jgi:Zn-finger nucleic acid-binding protein
MTYRDVQLRCPRCRTPLAGKHDNACCDWCGGVWMDIHNLRDLYETESTRRLSELEPFPDGSPCRPCAVCEQTMVSMYLDLIRLEGCSEDHGLWLVEGDFEKLIAHAKLKPGASLDELGFKGPPPARRRREPQS